MKKCLKISVNSKNAQKAKQGFVQKKAHEYRVEGVVQQFGDDHLVIYVCGGFDQVDDFVDALYVGSSSYAFDDIEVESCSPRDYRGVFRVI